MASFICDPLPSFYPRKFSLSYRTEKGKDEQVLYTHSAEDAPQKFHYALGKLKLNLGARVDIRQPIVCKFSFPEIGETVTKITIPNYERKKSSRLNGRADDMEWTAETRKIKNFPHALYIGRFSLCIAGDSSLGKASCHYMAMNAKKTDVKRQISRLDTTITQMESELQEQKEKRQKLEVELDGLSARFP